MPPGRSGGGYASPLPPVQPDPTQAPPVGEASLSVQPAPPPMQYPSTWGQMAAAPPPQAVDIQAPPTTDAQWQAQQYASGDAYSTGIDAAPDWTPQPPSQSHAWDAMYGAPPLQNRTNANFSQWGPYWDGSGMHHVGAGLGQGAIFTGYQNPAVPHSWDDIVHIMSGPSAPSAPGGLTAFANYLTPGGGQRLADQLVGPVIYGINPSLPRRTPPLPIGSPAANAAMKATPEPVSYLSNLVFGALLPSATPFTDTNQYTNWRTRAPSVLQPLMPVIDPAIRALDQWDVPWWMRAQFRPPAPPFAASRTPTNDDWYSMWLFGNQPAQREIPPTPLPPDTGYVPRSQPSPPVAPFPNPDDRKRTKVG